jgi:cysteine-rich repeat protein
MKRRLGVLAIAMVALLALTRPVVADCVGDCDGDGKVLVNELIIGINIALGTSEVTECPSFDADDSGVVSVAELIAAVNNALTGCKTTAECGNGTKESGEECDDGNTSGGDGCAENCTLETTYPCTFAEEASATLQTYLFGLFLPLEGSYALSIGKATDSSGERPAVIRASAMRFEPVVLPGVACVCVRGGTLPEFGDPNIAEQGSVGCGEQGLDEVSYFAPIEHNTNAADPNCELGDLEYDVPCVGGACQGGTLNKDSCKADKDCKAKHPKVCNGKLGLQFTGGGPRGSVFMRGATSISLIPDGGKCVKNCDPTLVAMGPDCLPCTQDDRNQAEPKPMPFTTGTAEGEVLEANNDVPYPQRIVESSRSSGISCSTDANCPAGETCWSTENVDVCSGEPDCKCLWICSSDVCVTKATGRVVDCGALAGDPNVALSGSSLVGALSSVDTATIADNVVTGIFACK